MLSPPSLLPDLGRPPDVATGARPGTGRALPPSLAGLVSLVGHLAVLLTIALLPVWASESATVPVIVGWTEEDAPDRPVEPEDDILAPEVASPPGGEADFVDDVTEVADAGDGLSDLLAGERTLGLDAVAAVGGRPGLALDETVRRSGARRGTGGGVGSGQGFAGLDAQLADPEQVSFFGLQFPARRIVFVVDRSGSMRGRRWTLVQRELLKTLETMSSRQQVYAVLFNTEAFPLFGAPPDRTWAELVAGVEPVERRDVMVHPTAGNVERVRTWLGSFEAEGFTSPVAAMAMAVTLEPDAIVFLTDGEFEDGTVDLLRANRARLREMAVRTQKAGPPPPKVYTVGMHAIAAGRQLQLIADENEGVYRFVK